MTVWNENEKAFDCHPHMLCVVRYIHIVRSIKWEMSHSLAVCMMNAMMWMLRNLWYAYMRMENIWIKMKFISSQGAYTLCRYAQFSHRIASSSSNCVDMICNDDEWRTCTDDSQLSTPDLARWFVWMKQQTGEEKNEWKGSLISSLLWLPQPVADAVAALI